MAKQYKYRESFTFEGKRYDVKANSKRELAEKIAIRKRELEEGSKTLKGGTITVSKWAELCFDQYKNNIEPITLKNQKYKYNKWIDTNIGTMRLKDVKPLHCQQIMNSMAGMALDTIRKVKQLLNFLFQKAIENGMLRDNPAQYLSIPKGGKKTRRAITPKERKAIIETAGRDSRYVYFLAMLYCGCRPSEVAELKGMDVQQIDGANILHIRGTKSSSANRYVPIPDELFDVLPKVSPFDYIFTNERGGRLSESNRQALWRSFRRELNLTMGCKTYRNQLIPPFPVAPDLTPYCLRHSYCTDLQKLGVDLRTAQYLMGHSDVGMKANIYTHTDTETLLGVAETMRKKGKNVETGVETNLLTIAN